MTTLKKLKTLVMMQLRDKLDLSFIRSVRSTIFKVVLSIVKLVVVTAVFFLLFFVCNLLSVFYPSSYIPDTVVNVIFTLIQVMSIVTCTLGLTRTLYMTADNRVLLTLPVSSTQVYISKLILYYIFELKKNITLTLPLFIAYGIVNGAVWYFYPWLLFCFLFVSLVPVAIASIISIPTLYVWHFVKAHKWLQIVLTVVVSGLVIWGIVEVIGLIPVNIDIMGQWYAITLSIQDFLNSFARIFAPYYYLTLMMVGGTLRIGSIHMIQGDTFLYWGVMFASVAALLALSFAVARPLFIYMASRQFEYEKRTVKPKKNRVHGKRTSPFFESLNMELKSSTFVITSIVQLVLPAIAILFLNKLYAAMNTNYAGQIMTKAFNLLVMMVMTLAFNNAYASIYSKEAAARNILKTRPQKPIYTLFGRIVIRAAVIVVSTLAVTIVYMTVSSADVTEIILMGLITLLVSEAHLLWCAELDIMRNFADQYQTVGIQFDSPNERNATIISFLLSALFAFLYYFLSDAGLFGQPGSVSSLIKGLMLAVLFAAARAYLFVTRAKLYFVEK